MENFSKINDYNEEKPRRRSPQKKVSNILEAFENIVDLASESNLNIEFYTEAAPYIRYASRRLGLTDIQTVLLSIFVDRSEDSRIMLSEIARFLGCRTTRILRLKREVDVLEEKHYIIASRCSNSLSYRVPEPVLKALGNNKPYVHTYVPIIDTSEFFDAFRAIMRRKSNDEIDYKNICNRVDEMLEEIKLTAFAREMKALNLDRDDRTLLIFMAHLFVENNDDNIRFGDIDDLYDENEIPSWSKRELRNRSSELFKLNLIENTNEDGMARSDAFKLTDSAKQKLLSELNLATAGTSTKGLIEASSLTEKKMYYNPVEEELVDQLTGLLSPSRFKDVQSRLKDAGMREGFCCLFYGSPGTGKTETVYQLARITGRDIMKVDVDKIKSCWVGDSEKNIKALFDRYRKICSSVEHAPILLFNEADAVLGVRMEGASRAVDKMENSLQNIILQEMETLPGIMIATTNLTTNLDKAFERRFLYKIHFDKPSVKGRAMIWRSMLKGLSQAEAEEIAAKHDLSGGEIENIARRHTVNAILTGNDTIDLKELSELCGREKIAARASKVGF